MLAEIGAPFSRQMLDAVEGLNKTLHSLIQPLLNLTANHHTHHHIEFAVKNHTDTGIGRSDLVELNPEVEVDRHAAIVAGNLDMLTVDLIDHTQFDGKALDLERAGVRRRLPLLDFVRHGRCKEREIGYERIDLRHRSQYLLLFRLVFFHVSEFCDTKVMFFQ